MWDIQDVRLGMWGVGNRPVGDVGCWECVMFRMWDVGDVGCWG